MTAAPSHIIHCQTICCLSMYLTGGEGYLQNHTNGETEGKGEKGES